MTPKTIAALVLAAVASLAPRAASAHDLKMQFQVSAVVHESCSVAIEAGSSAAAQVSLRTMCGSGAASTSTVGSQGAVASASSGAPTRVSSARVRSSVAGTPDVIFVTLSF